MNSIEYSAETDIDAPAAAVWALVADYGRDPEWREGVATMAPAPPGVVRPGTTTDERMRAMGRAYRNGGVVGEVEPGVRFTWRTTSGVDADGARTVRDLGDGRSRLRLEVRLRPHGAQRLFAPLLRVVLHRGLVADTARLRALVECSVPRT
ncbi:SRPBCC family protein [Pseudonocardia sp. KRD-184]|uniref:SRPBCC family protein n=1 Tax=Pseudonocardia oceani TaxID=2792013 RepID=A0ABS6U5U7_9PSEU|nr:SRPBCC family protein [Pseudonocardia oceani]MBW0090218.1 SRPBCC family protein [Pseudonocardia oceani]MBW0095696.1 SRPBCC family protein [Pseudonocardia oceani]MBW0122568.1 SRPBCC family protein [Pseudonocardia oceani]MBW0127534.1 SRPBCC family protein [Pseudonocardia oceani]